MYIPAIIDSMVRKSRKLGVKLRSRRFAVCEFCNAVNDSYMVKPEVWTECGFNREFVCLSCLSSHLGRPLTIDDFSDATINIPIFTAYNMALEANKEPS